MGHGADPGRGVSQKTRIHHEPWLRAAHAGRAVSGNGAVRREPPPGTGPGSRFCGIGYLLAKSPAQHGHAGGRADRAGTAVGSRLAGGDCGVLQHRHAVLGRGGAGRVQPRQLLSFVLAYSLVGRWCLCRAGVCHCGGVDSDDSRPRHRCHHRRHHQPGGGGQQHRGDAAVGRADCAAGGGIAAAALGARLLLAVGAAVGACQLARLPGFGALALTQVQGAGTGLCSGPHLIL